MVSEVAGLLLSVFTCQEIKVVAVVVLLSLLV